MKRLLLASLVLAGCGIDSSSSRAAQLASPLCQGTDAKKAFGTNAVCTCEDLALVGAGFLARNSGTAPANVGVNGTSQVVGLHEIGGSLIAMKGIAGVGEVSVGADLSTAGDVAGVGRVTVGRDMMVGGHVANVGELDVKGTLGAAGEVGFVGVMNAGSRGAYVAPTEPCGCGALAVDVAAKVSEAKNSATQLGASSSVGTQTLELHSGSYYAESLASVGAIEVKIDGAVALAIGGSLESVGLQRITLTQGSTLDLYVAGSIATVGDSLFGEGADPGSVRIFVGGSAASVGAQTFNASIYMPRADLSLVGDTVINGAVFARSIGGVGRLTVDYAQPTAADPDKCVVEDPPPGGNPGTPPNGPMDPG